MTKATRPPSEDAAELRRRAEERLDGSVSSHHAPAAHERMRLQHELEVHQIELELQNEELRSARLHLEAGLQRYTELFDFAPIGYVILVGDAAIQEINHAGAKLLGSPRSRLVGLRLGAFLAGRDVAAFNALLRATTTEVRQSCEVILADTERRLRLTATTLDGSEPKTLLAFEDITAARAREEQLARAEAALRETNHRKDEFLAVLSHELRNPLGPIRNSAHVLRLADPGSTQACKALDVIERQVAHLTRLVDDLLDVTRIAHGKIELQRADVELADLVRRTLDDHRASFEVDGIRLEGELEPGAFWVRGDAARLVQALSNVLGNAEKFTPCGGSVTVVLRRVDARALLQVRDTGVGIEPHVLPHLFEPFSQAPQAIDRSRGGLGLGLAMVKGLVELHGGAVAIASDGLGRGASLTISLPLVADPARRERAPSQLVPHGRRVLVIEDSLDAAESLQAALELGGHDVRVARDGLAGLELAHRFRPEIVLCDIGLPGMDGYAVARAFRTAEDLTSMYLVALSGYAQPEHIRRAAEAGFDTHIAKPPSLDKLERLLAAAPPSA